MGLCLLAELTLHALVDETSLQGWVVQVLIDLGLWVVGAEDLSWGCAFESLLRGVLHVRSDDDLVGILEELSQLVVDAILDSEQRDDADLILRVHHLEELLVGEALGIEETWVTLELRRPFNLNLGAILKHLSAHLSNSFAAVFLQLGECSHNVVLKLADELLSWVTKWVNVINVCKQVHDNVALRWLLRSKIVLALLRLTEVLHLLLEQEWVTHAHHDPAIILIHTVRQGTFVAFSSTWLQRVLSVLVLVVVILVLITEAALPLCAIFLLLLLEDLYLDARDGNLNLPRVTADDLLDDNAIVDLVEHLDVLIHVDVGTPAVGHSEQGLLEADEVHLFLATSVMDPLLGDFAVHLLGTVQWKQHFVNAFHKLSKWEGRQS